MLAYAEGMAGGAGSRWRDAVLNSGSKVALSYDSSHHGVYYEFSGI